MLGGPHFVSSLWLEAAMYRKSAGMQNDIHWHKYKPAGTHKWTTKKSSSLLSLPKTIRIPKSQILL